MSWTHCIRNERGVALITVLYVALVVAVLSTTAVLLSMTSAMVNRNTDRELSLESVADAGIEIARSRVNGTPAIYPASGYTTLEQDATVTDAGGTVIPNVTRSVYVGPTGITSGQYGVFGSAVSIARDRFGNTVVRRGEIVQESFAKYAYFTDIEPSNISFGGGDQIFGPVHTNDYLKIYSSGATFFGPVTTAKTVEGAQYGTFAQGYTEHVRRIEMPQTADLLKLQTQAQAGNTAFVGNTNGAVGQATTRIEFVAIDLNGDGEVNGTNEGFIRVYQSSDAGWVTADIPSDYTSGSPDIRLRNSLNCGHFHGDTLKSAKAHTSSTGTDSYIVALTGSGRRCLLGGADAFSGGFQAVDTKGQWLAWPGAVSGLLAARADKQYLFPITRELNPNFKGVIFVQGKVVLSGVLRGRVTVAATSDIIIGDDLTYATDPGAGTCNDIMGLFSGTDVVVADNTINSPLQAVSSSSNYYTFDETRDEFIQGVVLALSNFTVENYDAGATSSEPCGTTSWGRGCLYLTGGIIQSTRGAVGTTAGTGYLKRYSYDACAFTDPPPYFPTTGVFARGRYFEVDPVGFNVANYFQLLTPPGN